MGRKPKFLNNEPNSLEEKVAEYIEENSCNFPGCMAEFHLDEAEVIIRMVTEHIEQREKVAANIRPRTIS